MQLRSCLYAQISIQQFPEQATALEAVAQAQNNSQFSNQWKIQLASALKECLKKTSTLYTHQQKVSRRFYFIIHALSSLYMILGVLYEI